MQLYKDESENNNIDLLRMDIFCHKTLDIDRIPPTSDALSQHLKRSVYQASIWATAYQPLMPQLSHENFGWKKHNDHITPIWTLDNSA